MIMGNPMEQTFAEKILAKKATLERTSPGQIVRIIPDRTFSVDNTARIIRIFKSMGAERIFDPKHAIILDHNSPPSQTQHAESHLIIRRFVAEQQIEFFYDVGRGICHQVLMEEGLALPGEVLLGADSHTPHAGAFGAFSAGIGHTEMAAVWALGHIWLRVPESMKIVVKGLLPLGVTAKDLALHIIGDLKADAGLYMSVEWHGEAIRALNIDQRSVLTNMMTEMGVKNSYIPPDQKVFDYLSDRAKRSYEPVYPDDDAHYARVVEYDASSMAPMVACPHAVDNVVPLAEVIGRKIDQAFIGTCANGRLDDLAAAAMILQGRRVAPGTRMIIIPASSEIYLNALKAGYIETFIKAGAMVESPGCGPCLGGHMGIPAAGETIASSSNRNFQGRMGTNNSEIYLASPEVVAAAGVAGMFVYPRTSKDCRT
jgi:3-isopropylmalate/(R)-2-methylmalate dehydratase large subunit